MKKLIKSDICGSVNSTRMHCSWLKKSAFTAESKKKKKKKLKRVLRPYMDAKRTNQTYTQCLFLQTSLSTLIFSYLHSAPKKKKNHSLLFLCSCFIMGASFAIHVLFLPWFFVITFSLLQSRVKCFLLWKREKRTS